MASEQEERRAAYEICKQRGHQPSGLTLACIPPLQVCKWCSTQYRFETTLVEQNVPEAVA